MPATIAYSTARVDTSVAVATPPPTAPRIKKGKSKAGPAMMKVRRIVMNGARLTPSVCSLRAFHRANTASATSSTMATTTPLLKRPAIDTPATEPSTIKTILGGTVSAMAAPVASSAIISRGLWPRRFISGKSAGATVAMSDTLEPEIPDTINSDPSSTYDMPALTWPTSDARKSMMALPMPVASSTQPSSTKMGTDTSTKLLMPSSIRLITTSSGIVVLNAKKHNVPMPKQNAIGTPATKHTATKPTKNIGMFRLPSVCNVGDSSQHAPPIRAIKAVAVNKSILRELAQAWRSTRASISAMPIPIADTRKPLGKFKSGVRIIHSDLTYSTDGCSKNSKKLAMTSRANVLTKLRKRSGSISTKTLSRRCSLRSTANTEPNIATHKNAIDATSSIQLTG